MRLQVFATGAFKKSMRVLMVHASYSLGLSGEDTVVGAESQALREHGHAVSIYRTTSADLLSLSVLDRTRAGAGVVWSRYHSKKISEYIVAFRPDIIHVHNTFGSLSDSVIAASARFGPPVVQTLHNYRFACPNGHLFRQSRPCLCCLGRKLPWPAVAFRCYKRSFLQSAGATAAGIVSQIVRMRGSVTMYLALTSFMRRLLLRQGVDADRCVVKPNFLSTDPGLGTHDGGYGLFVGRLSDAKGVRFLLRAWRSLPDVPLVIVGDGPLRHIAERAAATQPNITYVGRQDHAATLDMMRNAALLAFPTRWYEGMPMVLLEALSTGLPTVGTNIGATAALIGAGAGRLFDMDDEDMFVRQVREIIGMSRPAALSLSNTCRARFTASYSPQVGYSKLMNVYENVSSHAGRPMPS